MPPCSTTLCWLGPLFVQTTWPSTPTVTIGGLKAKSTMFTAADEGPPATTLSVPDMDAPWMPQM